jgi:hypothetical protein
MCLGKLATKYAAGITRLRRDKKRVGKAIHRAVQISESRAYRVNILGSWRKDLPSDAEKQTSHQPAAAPDIHITYNSS